MIRFIEISQRSLRRVGQRDRDGLEFDKAEPEARRGDTPHGFFAIELGGDSKAQRANDHRSHKNAGVLMADGVITGVQTISGIELARITVDLIGSCFDKGKEKLEDTIRASFQERGVLAATVNTELKARAHWVSPNP